MNSMENTVKDYWRRCSTCKSKLNFNTDYWVCNVSTCNRKRTGLVFCTVECWDAHNPMMNHRESWAEERTAPSKESVAASNETSSPSAAVISTSSTNAAPMTMGGSSSTQTRAVPQRRMIGAGSGSEPREVLAVASKVKAYIKQKADMNTGASFMERISDVIRVTCDLAITEARQEGRKTVLDRDIK